MAESVDLRPLVPPQTFVAKDRTRAMIRAEIKRNNEAIERAIGTALGTLLREVEARVNALEAKTNRLEAAMAEFAYKGAWEQVKQYRRGNFVSFGGGIWHANVDTREKPGVNGDWALACKL
jgi:hypothetical protein